MLRNVISTNYVSLDGVIQDPVGMESSGLGNWTGPFKRGPSGDKFKHEELMHAGALILGRITYDGFAAVWPTIKDPAGFADRINSLPKYVASQTLKHAAWNNTTILQGDLVTEVAALKASGEGDILIYGSASIVHALMPRNLIDEYRQQLNPTILGRDTRLFPEGASSTLKLVESCEFGDGIVLLRYSRPLS